MTPQLTLFYLINDLESVKKLMALDNGEAHTCMYGRKTIDLKCLDGGMSLLSMTKEKNSVIYPEKKELFTTFTTRQ